jgi:hypothetical protein
MNELGNRSHGIINLDHTKGDELITQIYNNEIIKLNGGQVILAWPFSR